VIEKTAMLKRFLSDGPAKLRTGTPAPAAADAPEPFLAARSRMRNTFHRRWPPTAR